MSRTDLRYIAIFIASLLAMVVGSVAANIVITWLPVPHYPVDVQTLEHFNMLVTTVGAAIVALVMGAGFLPLTWAMERWGAKPKRNTAAIGAVVTALAAAGFYLVTLNAAYYAPAALYLSVWPDVISIGVVGALYPLTWFLSTRR
jgi:uncharacterized membrane protein YeaQ/YmgE (transglycosylase-associated protein family)